MKKRLLSLFLCAVMIFGFVPGLAAAAKDTGLNIYCDGEQVSNIGLPEKTPVTVKALLSESTAGSFQWQIRVSNGVWASIIGSSDNALTLRYAMVANLLNEDGQAVVRCRFTPVDGKAIYSNELTVQMVSDMALMTIAAAEENSFTFTVLDPGSVVIHDTAKEPEKTPAPTETPASEESAAPSEEPAPTEEPAAPTEEPAPAEESGDAGVSNAVTVTVTAPKVEPQPESQAESQPESQAESQAESQVDSPLASQSVKSYALANTALQNNTVADDISGAGETPSTYNVVINYVFENNEIVADPYTANLAAGSDFSATVTFPTVQGYLPYVGEATESTTSMDLNITNIQGDVTYKVVYKPTNVDYTVIHYQQNVDNDMYREVERETKQGLTNSTVPEVAKTYEGFYSLIYERPNIAADGSTVIEVYYDRYYYLMNFDLDGGYGVEPIYARYGTPIDNVGTPTKAGHNFSGWSLDGTTVVSLPKTMPAENRTYKALWEAEATAKVTVVFWGENADDEDYSYLRSTTVDRKPGESYTYDGSSDVCPMEEHTHDSTCGVNCEHSREHIPTLECYGISSAPVDPNDGYGDDDARNHFENSCNQEACQNANLKQYLKDGSVCQYKNGYKEWGIKKYEYFYFLYLGGQYYEITESQYNNWKSGTGKSVVHGRDTYYVYEGKANICNHIHDDSCYTCGKITHTHGSNCEGLWKFKESDTVTVAADGSSVVNVYYDRTEKTLTFKYNYSYRYDNYQSTETITAKWGSNISEQYKKIAANAGSTFWSAETSGSGPYTNYFGVMPQTSATYYNSGDTGDEGTMTYWGQDLNGEYTVKLFEVTGVGGYYVSDEDRYEFEGFTYHHGTENDEYCAGANFYYTRNSYTLTFNDGYEDVKTESVQYEAPLSTYKDYVPAVPSAYEPGSVTFGGWYLNPKCTGAEYKLDEHTMPASDVILYAKWVPNTHTVKFSLDKTAYEKNELLSTHPTETVSHGSKLSNVAEPENGGYTFVGWFYEENGVEKAFDFANMEIRKDLHVYGKWSSNTLKQYTVQFVLQNDHSVKVADDITGAGLAGTTKTFDAKGGTDLYADYQEGFFPTVKSQSLLLDINATELVITFEYVQMPNVPYTVRYINTDTNTNVFDGKKIADKVVSDNKKAVVTERFEVIPGYMPDAYQKRLVVTAEGENILIFYYTRDTEHAYYKITHYTQNTDGKTWTEYASSQAVGDIGTTYEADAMDIPGFTYDPSVEGTLTSGELTAGGLELKLYYTRNSYPYQVRYLEKDTGNVLAPAKDGNGLYGQVISESAIEIDGYDKVDPTTASISIRIETPDDDGKVEARLNMITFYYTEKTVEIKYVPVGPAGAQNFGSVDPTSETVKIKTGTAAGSTPTAGDGFKFAGWYKDEACTEPVTGANWIVGNVIKPQKENGMNIATTYYAKFEYDVADLTITKRGCENIDEKQSFLFDVTRPDGYSQRVVVNGNGSVTIKGLKIGEYTVKEVTSWSWRYTTSNNSKKITLKPTENNTVTFENNRSKDKWLGGDAYKQNIFKNIFGN